MRQRRVATVVGCAILGLVAGFVIHYLISETRVVTAIHLSVVGLLGGVVLGLGLGSLAKPRVWHGLLWAIPAALVAVIPSIAIRASAGDLPFTVIAIDHVELIVVPFFIVYGFLGPSVSELARRVAPAPAASPSAARSDTGTTSG